MPLIINIETSTTACSVCLSNENEVLGLNEIETDNAHSGKLAVYIDELINKSGFSARQLDAISVSQGPGSYTGLRIGVSTAKGMAYALNIPLIAVNTLQAMALSISSVKNYSHENYLFCPMIDARRMEVYTALYDDSNNCVEDIKALIIDSNSYSKLLETNKIVFFGSGASKVKDLIFHENAIFIDNYILSAKNMIRFSVDKFNNQIFENVAYFEPFYLKDFVATQAKKYY